MKVELNLRIKGGPLDGHHLSIELDDDPRYGNVELRLGAEREFGYPLPDDCDSPHAVWRGQAQFDVGCDGYVLDLTDLFIPGGETWLGTEAPADQDGTTPRGFAAFGTVPSDLGQVRVQESSRAGEGAWVWLFHDIPEETRRRFAETKPDPVEPSIQLDVAAAERLAHLLLAFVRSARAGSLTEPAGRPA